MQPVVDLASHRVFGCEALLRSKAPGFKSPIPIIEAALANGFMGTLGRALRDMAVTACPDLPLFLNLNPAEFDEGWSFAVARKSVRDHIAALRASA